MSCVDVCTVTNIHPYRVPMRFETCNLPQSGNTTEFISKGAWLKSRPEHQLYWDFFCWFFSVKTDYFPWRCPSIGPIQLLSTSFKFQISHVSHPFDTEIISQKLLACVRSRLTTNWLKFRIIWWFGSVTSGVKRRYVLSCEIQYILKVR
jgi:hypothetical protein